MKALEKHSGSVRFLYKGESVDKDEYSIFQSEKGAADMKRHIDKAGITDIVICRLAGDVCEANTLRDAIRIYSHIRFHVLSSFTASLDGGAVISSVIC